MTDLEFRTYLLCPKLYKFSSSYPLTLHQKNFFYILNGIISSSLLKGYLDSSLRYSKIFHRSIKELGELDKSLKLELFNVAAKLISEVFNSNELINAIPLAGPSIENYSKDKVNISLPVSGMFLTSQNKITVLLTSPYQEVHSIQNDYVLDLTIQRYREIYTDVFKNKKITFLVIALSASNNLILVKKEFLGTEDVDILIDEFNNSTFLPHLPCNRKCEFKSECKR